MQAIASNSAIGGQYPDAVGDLVQVFHQDVIEFEELGPEDLVAESLGDPEHDGRVPLPVIAEGLLSTTEHPRNSFASRYEIATMTNRFHDEIERLRACADDSDLPDAEARLRQGLASENNLVVERAATIAREQKREALEKDMQCAGQSREF